MTGWTATGSSVQFLAIGGAFGNYSAVLNGTLSQDIATNPEQHYTLALYAGDAEASSSSLSVNWDGVQVLSVSSVGVGFTQYTFDVVGSALSTTHLDITGLSDGTGPLLDRVALGEVPGLATETAAGSVAFSDPEAADVHTASFVPQAGDYVGTFSLDPVSESGGSGSVGCTSRSIMPTSSTWRRDRP